MIKKSILPIVLGLLLLAGCGGGGNVGIPPVSATEKTFNLYDPKFYEPRYKAVYSLKGTDSVGDNLKMIITYNTLDKINYKGETAIPVNLLAELENISKRFFFPNIERTEYYKENRELIERVASSKGITYTLITVSVIPPLGERGDFGTLTSFSKSDGTTISGTWALEDAGGGWANLKKVMTGKDSNDSFVSSEELVFTIDEYHNIKSILYKLSTNSGYSIELTGTKIL
jgi:hypothetical protein